DDRVEKANSIPHSLDSLVAKRIRHLRCGAAQLFEHETISMVARRQAWLVEMGFSLQYSFRRLPATHARDPRPALTFRAVRLFGMLEHEGPLNRSLRWL